MVRIVARNPWAVMVAVWGTLVVVMSVLPVVRGHTPERWQGDAFVLAVIGLGEAGIWLARRRGLTPERGLANAFAFSQAPLLIALGVTPDWAPIVGAWAAFAYGGLRFSWYVWALSRSERG